MIMNLIFVIGKKLLKFDNIINFISKINSIMEELLKFKINANSNRLMYG